MSVMTLSDHHFNALFSALRDEATKDHSRSVLSWDAIRRAVGVDNMPEDKELLLKTLVLTLRKYNDVASNVRYREQGPLRIYRPVYVSTNWNPTTLFKAVECAIYNMGVACYSDEHGKNAESIQNIFQHMLNTIAVNAMRNRDDYNAAPWGIDEDHEVAA